MNKSDLFKTTIAGIGAAEDKERKKLFSYDELDNPEDRISAKECPVSVAIGSISTVMDDQESGTSTTNEELREALQERLMELLASYKPIPYDESKPLFYGELREIVERELEKKAKELQAAYDEASAAEFYSVTLKTREGFEDVSSSMMKMAEDAYTYHFPPEHPNFPCERNMGLPEKEITFSFVPGDMTEVPLEGLPRDFSSIIPLQTFAHKHNGQRYIVTRWEETLKPAGRYAVKVTAHVALEVRMPRTVTTDYEPEEEDPESSAFGKFLREKEESLRRSHPMAGRIIESGIVDLRHPNTGETIRVEVKNGSPRVQWNWDGSFETDYQFD